MPRVLSMFGLVCLLVVSAGCANTAGRNVREGRAWFAERHKCPKEAVKAENAGKLDKKDDDVLGANLVKVEGCGKSEMLECETFKTSEASSDVGCSVKGP